MKKTERKRQIAIGKKKKSVSNQSEVIKKNELENGLLFSNIINFIIKDFHKTNASPQTRKLQTGAPIGKVCVQKVSRLKLYLSRQQLTMNEKYIFKNNFLIVRHSYTSESSLDLIRMESAALAQSCVSSKSK